MFLKLIPNSSCKTVSQHVLRQSQVQKLNKVWAALTHASHRRTGVKQRSCPTPGPVTTWMGDSLQTAKPSQHCIRMHDIITYHDWHVDQQPSPLALATLQPQDFTCTNTKNV